MNIIHKVAGIILYDSKEDSILFQLRDNNPAINEPNLWVLPGGHVNEIETVLDGLKREILEETSYALNNPLFCYGFSYETNNLGVKYYFYYENYDLSTIILCNEGQRMKFFRRREYLEIDKPWYLNIVLNRFTHDFNLFK